MSSIRNFGILWERKYFFYGWQGVAGHLKGYCGDDVVDFRQQRGVYVLYDKDMLPVYVGQAGKGKSALFNRLKDHLDDHLWNRWGYFSWFGLLDTKKDKLVVDVGAKSGSPVSASLDEIEGTYQGNGAQIE